MQPPYAVFVTRLGGPEVLEPRAIPMPTAQPGQLVLEHTAIGVNFVDIYLRAGQPHSHNPEPPFVPGINAVGRVIEVGRDVDGFQIGDRVTYTNAGVGSYATHVALSAERAVKVPAALSDVRIAAGLVRALTAQYLLKQMRPLKPGDTVLIHAAAGGVGQILVQWAKRLGLRVVATVGSDIKASTARELGADFVINYSTHHFVDEVKRITQGEGVSVVYDSVGRDTFMGSLACLETKGLVVNFGTASGQVEGFALQELHAKSLWVCRPTLRSYIAKRSDLLAMCEEVFELLADPTIRLDIEATLPLHEAAQAHRLLEGRTTRGAIVLTPAAPSAP
jgi:NADPH:quinone reductase